MERPTIVKPPQPQPNGGISLTKNQDLLNGVEVETETGPLELLKMNRTVIDRKCQITATRKDYFRYRTTVLKTFDRNAFNLEVSLFMKLLIQKENYGNMRYMYGEKRITLIKTDEGESCLPSLPIDSQKRQLKLTF